MWLPRLIGLRKHFPKGVLGVHSLRPQVTPSPVGCGYNLMDGALQVGLGYSVGMGTGLVVARREEDDSWSAPSAIAALSCGWGLQVT